MTAHHPRLLIALMTTSLAACMARHAEPEESVLDYTEGSTSTSLESAAVAPSPDPVATTTPVGGTASVPADAVAPVTVEQLSVLGYAAAEDDADMTAAPRAEPAPMPRTAAMNQPQSASGRAAVATASTTTRSPST